MSDTSAHRVSLSRAGGGRYDKLQNYVDAKIVKVNYRNSYVVTPANADVVLLDDTVVPGAIAVGMATTVGNGQVMCSELAGAVGTAEASVLTDEDGGYLNMVELRDGDTNDPILTADDASGRRVYGVMQCANGVADGAPVGAAAAENLQMSFVYFDATDTLQPHSLNQTVQFGVPVIRMLRNRSPLALDEGVTMADVVGTDPVEQKRWHTRKLNILTNAGAGATINIDTAVMSAGTAEVDAGYAETVALGANATEFFERRVLINGRRQDNDNYTWVSATEFTWTGELYQGDTVWVEEWKVPAAAAAMFVHTIIVDGTAIGAIPLFGSLHLPSRANYEASFGNLVTESGDLNILFGPDQVSNDANVTISVNGVPWVWGTDITWADPTDATLGATGIDGGSVIVITSPYSV